MPLVSRAHSQPAPSYRASRVAFDNPAYDEEWSSDSEWEPRPPRRWNGAPAVDGLGARDLNRMEGRLRDRQTATSRKTAPDNYDLYNGRTSRRATVDRDNYPGFTAPASSNYEATGHATPYGYPDYFTDPYAATRPATTNHAGPPPFTPASYPNPQGNYAMNNQNPFARKPSGGPPNGMPRRRPPLDTEMNRMREELEDLKMPRGREQGEAYWQDEETEETEETPTEEHRVKKKRPAAQRTKAAKKKEQEDMRREIERQVNAKLEKHLRGVSNDRRSNSSGGPDVDSILRNLLGRMSTGGPGTPEGWPTQQERQSGEYDQILDLAQGHRRLHGNSSLAKLLADHVTSSAAGDLILRRLDDLIYQQRRVEDAVGGLLGHVRDPSMNGRAAVPTARPPSAPVPQSSDMERDYETQVGPSKRPSRSRDPRSSRQALRRLSDVGGLRDPSYTETEDVLSKRSTDATLEALRRRSRPASPVESEDDLEFNYDDIQRKPTPAPRSRVRHRSAHRKSIEHRDGFPSEDSGDDYRPPAPQLAARRSFHGRPDGVDNIPLTDNVEVKIRRSRLGKKSKELRKREYPEEGPADRRRKTKSRPVVTRHKTPPAYLDDEPAEISEDSWENGDVFPGQPRPYYYDPLKQLEIRMACQRLEREA